MEDSAKKALSRLLAPGDPRVVQAFKKLVGRGCDPQKLLFAILMAVLSHQAEEMLRKLRPERERVHRRLRESAKSLRRTANKIEMLGSTLPALKLGAFFYGADLPERMRTYARLLESTTRSFTAREGEAFLLMWVKECNGRYYHFREVAVLLAAACRVFLPPETVGKQSPNYGETALRSRFENFRKSGRLPRTLFDLLH